MYFLCATSANGSTQRLSITRNCFLGIADQLTVDRIKSLIADLQAQKAALHPEQKQ